MRKIMAILILLFTILTGYGQSPQGDRLKDDEVFDNALNQYLKYLPATNSIDTIFIELNDTLNFNLPLSINKTVVKVLTFDSLLVHLRSKINPHYFKLTRWPKENKIDIVLYEVSIQYSEDEIVAITDSNIYRMTYLKSKDNFILFKKIDQDNNGCRYFHRITKDGHHSRESICS
jgi:hypothetical protein